MQTLVSALSIMKMRAAGLLVVAIGLTGCNTTYDNPFANVGHTSAPSANDDLVFVQSPPGSNLREIYSLDTNGTAPPTRLTSCGQATPPCDIIEVAPAPDRQHVVVRRRTDSNGDGTIQDAEPQVVFVMDLARALEGQILASTPGIDGMSWLTGDTPLLFSAPGAGGLDDLFVAAQDGTAINNFTQTSAFRERHPRLVGQLITFERAAPGTLSQIVGAITTSFPITTGDPSLPPDSLPGTDYIVGSDADADPNPDGSMVVFRRLVGFGENGRGAWDLYTAGTSGTAVPVPLAVGGFHGEPDWGPQGIVFVEIPPGSSTASLILIAPDGTRRTLLQGAPLTLQSPRWLIPLS
jgi:hypothetical protein